MKSYHNKQKGIGIIYDDIYLVGGARTPFGKLSGALSGVSPTDLGIFASRAALNKTGIGGDEIDQTIIANIGQCSYDSYFLPRHISLYSGIRTEVPSLMVQRICGSGFETIITAAEQITLGKGEVILCSGAESMSLSPTVSFGNRMGYQLGRVEFKDMLWESLNDTAAGYPMGHTAENVAKQLNITRNDTDEYAQLSSSRTNSAIANGFFKDEISPVCSTTFEADGLIPRKVKLQKKFENFSSDENVRSTTLDDLTKLPPVFHKDGVQTAGNSSGIVDGAASVIIADKNYLHSKGIKGMAKVVASASAGVDPKVMGLGPVPAIKLLLELTGLKMDDIGLFEINEAFAAQYIGCERELNLDRNITNVNGGAIAIGHPLAATGLRLSLTLSREMNNRKIKYAIASACIGGGQGTAVLFENENL
jgi:acetyl-CoA C-acetyltransferase